MQWSGSECQSEDFDTGITCCNMGGCRNMKLYETASKISWFKKGMKEREVKDVKDALMKPGVVRECR